LPQNTPPRRTASQDNERIRETSHSTEHERTRGPIPWPPCSPDYIPLDFKLGVSKDTVHNEKVQDTNKLPDKIFRAAENFTKEMLADAWQKN
jgi:hypothetical protein